MFDGHELAVGSTFVTVVMLVDRTLPTGWGKHMVHRHPMAALSCAFGAAGILMPMFIPKIRKAMGLATDQYDREHPGTVPSYWLPKE